MKKPFKQNPWTRAVVEKLRDEKLIRSFNDPVGDDMAAKSKRPSAKINTGKIISKFFPTADPIKNAIVYSLLQFANGSGQLLYGEYYFSQRGFRLDYAIPGWLIGIEYQGGIHSYQPSHTSAKAILRDSEKANLALSLGWVIVSINADTYRDIITIIQQILNSRNNAIKTETNGH